jgi:hypothetical protein
MTRRVTLLATAIATVLAAAGVQAQNASGDISPESTPCVYNFGSGNLVSCASADGNLMQFQSPAGAVHEHMRVATLWEGYTICVNNVAAYYDLGVVEAGFGPPVVISPPTASAVGIRRTTTDGKFQLDQKWTRDGTERDVKVTMTLRNLGPAATNVKLIRTGDIDVNNTPANDYYDDSVVGAWVRDGTADNVGVTMYGLTLTVPMTSVVDRNWALVPPLCAPVPAAVPGGPADPAVHIIYSIGSMKLNGSKTVAVGYRAQ